LQTLTQPILLASVDTLCEQRIVGLGGKAMTLYEYMKKQRITQVEMAELCDVSQPTLSRWLNQETYPDWYNLVKINEATTGLVTANDFYEQFVECDYE